MRDLNDPVSQRTDFAEIAADQTDFSKTQPRTNFDREHDNFAQRANIEKETSDRQVSQPKAGDILGMLADVHDRLKKVEADNADMRATIDKAQKSGDLNFDQAHAAFVLQKYFPHDRPDAEVLEPPRQKFDPYTGAALN